jgi:membrane associated rhomboid family serine protease
VSKSAAVLIPVRDHNPRTRFPAVTLLLITANVVTFLFGKWALSTPLEVKQLLLKAGAIPYEISHLVDVLPRDLLPVPGSILTSMFLHGGYAHLIGNMWFLWLFGDNVEEALGSVRYGFFYLLVGTVGALAQVFAMPDSMTPMIGASGAIAGVLGAYVMLYPHARIETFVPIPFLWSFIDLPAWLFLGFWFGGQFLLGAGSGVAWMAHVGGFLGGVGVVRLLAPPLRESAVERESFPSRRP